MQVDSQGWVGGKGRRLAWDEEHSCLGESQEASDLTYGILDDSQQTAKLKGKNKSLAVFATGMHSLWYIFSLQSGKNSKCIYVVGL